jgi:NAD(P)-dependent dehydrogenase (short-subunit alcohol dehydrogenase family)
MKDKVCIVTGATSGIGKEVARGLAGMGARVVVVGRNPEKSDEVAAEIRAGAGAGPVEIALGDLASLRATRTLAGELLERFPRIDVLVSNAGVYRLRRGVTEDGFEETFAVNHLAAFLLTNLLIDRLRASAPARVVVVASDAHVGQRLDFDDLQNERGYRSFRTYGRSKLANIMFTYSLARRLEGSGVTANCMHPGFVASNFGSGNRIPVRPVMLLLRPFALSPKQGADTAIWLASSPDLDGVSGGYFEKRTEHRSNQASLDVEAQERLWHVSAEMTGLESRGGS